MKESQRVEWKESWRDDCLKVISGFANAEGGTLTTGKNDAGDVERSHQPFRSPSGPPLPLQGRGQSGGGVS